MKSDTLSLQLNEVLLLQIALLALRASIGSLFRFDAFCQQHDFSVRGLGARFKQETGMSVAQYLHQLRLCKAMELLRYDRQTIGEVTAQCGFDDSNYFSVVFHQAQGISPSAYRQRFLAGLASKLSEQPRPHPVRG